MSINSIETKYMVAGESGSPSDVDAEEYFTIMFTGNVFEVVEDFVILENL